MRSIRYFLCAATTIPLIIALSGCGEKNANAQTAGGNPPPPEVSVVTISPQRVTLTTELPGRLEATRVAQVRARVPGIVLKRVYKEGSDVKAGDVLFRIDPASYQAALNSTEASVARAEANLAQANLKLNRYKPLVETNAISKQEFDDAVAAQKQASADVQAAKAARANARLNLGYATVNAPISGRIGRALVTEGALVGQGEATPLALIQQLDPIYATLTQSTAELLRLQRAMANGQLQRVGNNEAKVTLVMEDGSVYPQSGKLLFSDLNVDQSSGSVTLRAEFPNPQRFLLPGMYVRARLEQAVSQNAILVPQQAVQRDPAGAVVMVVGADSKVRSRQVKTASVQGNNWVISEGLKSGEQVIVEGLQKVKPGAPVKAVPWKPAGSNDAAPAQAAGQPNADSAKAAAPQKEQNAKAK
ncbi:efflux RND transporter periplasmic adaptor subunit [Oxalobacteraceae bacterium R-40]|uniref:Efflux RND transporter periplasmic adaptor subunit n=1 Tax=Keguizhuia sedimenti TaxID=3064264 RepID=A0ABU1BNU5_9BURK|nr:efflux RND transporter periplasmic adaptor subunit [Oxalobacteraceae bacterium R-40]